MTQHSSLFRLVRQFFVERDEFLLQVIADNLIQFVPTHKGKEAESYAVKLAKPEPFPGCRDRLFYWLSHNFGLMFFCDFLMKFGSNADKKLLGKTYRGYKYALKHRLKHNKNCLDLARDLRSLVETGKLES